MTRTAAVLIGVLASSLPLFAAAPPDAATYSTLAKQVDEHFDRHIVQAWFPRCLDKETGGFHPNWDRQWNRLPPSGKFIVFQSRMTWISAQIAMHRPALRDTFTVHALHGARFLANTLWDRDFGGFFWGLDEQGKPSPRFGNDKHLYGNAFGIYAAAAAYQATGDPAALDLAQRGFRWLEEHAHDRQHGGYHEAYRRDGTVIGSPQPMTPANFSFTHGGFVLGYKSMNAHIHMLEALATLYHVWKDDLVKARLAEMLAVVRDRIAVEPGCLNLYFTPDWRAVPDHDSVGHDVETGFLLIEAAESLGTVDARTLKIARMLVDHALDWAWDDKHGGFYDKAYAFHKAFDKKKVWWAEVEGLNALLLMHERFGRETDRYWNAFLKQWDFVRRHLIDAEFGGLYGEVEEDGRPIAINKGSNWKAAYHDGRSFLLVAERLRKLAGEK